MSLSTALRVLVGTAALVGAVIFVWIGPWRGGSSEPVLHAVIEGPQLQQTTLDLKTGAQTRVLQRLEYWFDSQRNLLRFTSSIDGQVNGQGLKQSNPDGQASLSPALDMYVTGYRQALAQGKAHKTGTGLVEGRHVIWVTIPDGASRQRVALDPTTYKPLAIEELDANGAVEPLVWQVKTIELVPRVAADFVAPPTTPSLGAQFTAVRALAPAQAASVLGWTPVWLGPAFGGFKLGSLEELHATAAHGAPLTEKTGLSFGYSQQPARIMLQEAPRPALVNGFLPDNPVPAAGQALLTSLSNGCRAQFETHGVWVTLDGVDTDACASVARSLVPIGASISPRPSIASSISAGAVQPPPRGPRASLCVGAWNRGASSKQRLTIAGEKPLHAAVSGNGTWFDVFGTTTGGKTFSTSSSGCTILFFLSKDRIVSATARWKNQTVSSWKLLAPVQIHAPATAGNASVAGDGTVRLHG